VACFSSDDARGSTQRCGEVACFSSADARGSTQRCGEVACFSSADARGSTQRCGEVACFSSDVLPSLATPRPRRGLLPCEGSDTFPFEEAKLDRSLVADLATNQPRF